MPPRRLPSSGSCARTPAAPRDSSVRLGPVGSADGFRQKPGGWRPTGGDGRDDRRDRAFGVPGRLSLDRGVAHVDPRCSQGLANGFEGVALGAQLPNQRAKGSRLARASARWVYGDQLHAIALVGGDTVASHSQCSLRIRDPVSNHLLVSRSAFAIRALCTRHVGAVDSGHMG